MLRYTSQEEVAAKGMSHYIGGIDAIGLPYLLEIKAVAAQDLLFVLGLHHRGGKGRPSKAGEIDRKHLIVIVKVRKELPPGDRCRGTVAMNEDHLRQRRRECRFRRLYAP